MPSHRPNLAHGDMASTPWGSPLVRTFASGAVVEALCSWIQVCLGHCCGEEAGLSLLPAHLDWGPAALCHLACLHQGCSTPGPGPPILTLCVQIRAGLHPALPSSLPADGSGLGCAAPPCGQIRFPPHWPHVLDRAHPPDLVHKGTWQCSSGLQDEKVGHLEIKGLAKMANRPLLQVGPIQNLDLVFDSCSFVY